MTGDMTRQRRRRIVPEMSGAPARWYARLRHSDRQIETYRTQAAQLTAHLPPGAAVLDVAPGPGYLAIEMARPGRVRVTGVDISRSFVDIAAEQALRSGVQVDFRQGDAARLPFDAASFDLVVCQAAFKNFTHPLAALDEMHRVLRGGGVAVIHDMRADASGADVDREVRRMGLSGFTALTTRAALRMLRRRAYTAERFTRLVADSAFETCDIRIDGIGLEARLTRPATV